MSGRKTFASFLLGITLVQSAWILATAPYRGIDEFDHVFKAAAVARGEWTNHGTAVDGRGGYVDIPGSIVRAANPVCEFLPYTGPDNCRASATYPNGDVQIATAASAYNPTYYLIVGTVAKPFGGDTADYVMRIVTAILCALMLAWAAVLITRWANTIWPVTVFVVGLSPVLVYSTSIASPNGLTYAGAALLWSAMIALYRTSDGGRTASLALPAVAGSVALVTSHTTGTMWLALIGVTSLVLISFRTWLAVVTRNKAAWIGAALIVLAIAAASSLWVNSANTNALGPVLEGAHRPDVWNLLRLQLLWILQAVAAFPALDEQAPPVVYAVWLLLLTFVFQHLVRRSYGRLRAALAVVLVFIVVVPSTLTLIAYPREGLAWQGRYTLPLWLGVILLAAVVVDRTPALGRTQLVFIPFGLMALAMAVSTVHVALSEVDLGVTEPAAATFPGGFVLVALLSVAGPLLQLATLRRADRELVS